MSDQLALGPLDRFEIRSQLTGGTELFEDQAALEPAADGLHLWGMACVVFLSSDGVIKNADQPANVVANVFWLGCPPMKHVDQFDIVRNTVPANYNVIVV